MGRRERYAGETCAPGGAMPVTIPPAPGPVRPAMWEGAIITAGRYMMYMLMFLFPTLAVAMLSIGSSKSVAAWVPSFGKQVE